MKRFKYVGDADEVDVFALGRSVKRGELVEVEDTDVSATLEDSDAWEHVPDPKRSAAAKKAANSNEETD